MKKNRPQPSDNGAELSGRPLATRKEVANRAQVCTETIKRWQREGKLKAIILSRQIVRYDWNDVDKVLAESRV